MFAEFRARYPTGSLVSQMLEFAQGQYVVSVAVRQEGEVLATGMAAAATLEEAEDRARIRALEAFGLVEIEYDGTVHLLGESTGIAQLSGTSSSQPLLSAGTEAAATTAAPTAVSDIAAPEAIAPPTQNSPPPPGLPPLELDFAPPAPAPTPPASSAPAPPRSPQPAPAPVPIPVPEVAPPVTAPVDLSDAIAQSNVLMKQLGWTKKQGVAHLQANYGKRTRAELTDQELMEFLEHLQTLAEPDF